MEIVPVVDRGLGNSSYVVDLGDGQALVVDPERDPAPYLAVAARRGLRLRWTAETHLHADFVTGSRELAAGGANLLAPAGSELAFDHVPLEGGAEVDLGGVTLLAIATPGHTPEHLAYLLADGPAPLAVFTGGTLMAGGVARTDLLSPDLTEPLARAAYRSIRDELLTLPDDLAVYPTHGAGSFCSVGAGGDRVTTIGRERAANPLLQAASEDDFVQRLIGGLGSFPPYFLRLRAVNRAGPAVYGPGLPAPAPIDPDEVERLAAGGAEVVDVRPIAAFAAGHVPGSLSVELRDQFATWLGWLVPPDRRVVLVAGREEDLPRVVWEARKVGLETIAGYLAGGVDAWATSGREVATIPLVAPADIDPAATILDVRQRSEWEAGHVPGATHIELGDVARAHIDGRVVVHCGHGQRAMTGASLLRRNGARQVAVSRADATQLAAALAAAR